MAAPSKHRFSQTAKYFSLYLLCCFHICFLLTPQILKSSLLYCKSLNLSDSIHYQSSYFSHSLVALPHFTITAKSFFVKKYINSNVPHTSNSTTSFNPNIVFAMDICLNGDIESNPGPLPTTCKSKSALLPNLLQKDHSILFFLCMLQM